MERNRFISVPKDKAALKLALNDVTAPSEIFIEVTLSEKDFQHLSSMAVFDTISDIANALVEDYESEEIIDMNSIKSIIEFLASLKLKTPNSDSIHKILYLFKEAETRGTGVFFNF